MNSPRQFPSDAPSWKSPLLTFMLVHSGGFIQFGHTVREKRALAWESDHSGTLYAIWTGEWNSDSDVFDLGLGPWFENQDFSRE